MILGLLRVWGKAGKPWKTAITPTRPVRVDELPQQHVKVVHRGTGGKEDNALPAC